MRVQHMINMFKFHTHRRMMEMMRRIIAMHTLTPPSPAAAGIAQRQLTKLIMSKTMPTLFKCFLYASPASDESSSSVGPSSFSDARLLGVKLGLTVVVPVSVPVMGAPVVGGKRLDDDKYDPDPTLAYEPASVYDPRPPVTE